MFFVKGFALLAVFAVIFNTACNANPPAGDSDFNSYWYSGKAEITRYELNQARYGEMRKGDAVLIFVTEDFRGDQQVKYEGGDRDNVVSVLKLNATKKFYTGIYPYSIMTSVFTPVNTDEMTTHKVSTSSQEWCGHTFMQLNNRNDKIHVLSRSYFQDEGDEESRLDKALLEDEIWTLIRLKPGSLPKGNVEMIPGTVFARLRHVHLKVEDAKAELSDHRDASLSGEPLQRYTITYPGLNRTLAITFEKAFPHQILAWEETLKSGFGPNAKELTTRAIKTHSIMTDYWSKNKLSDSHLRDDLGIIY
jgi:hypothetical protein